MFSRSLKVVILNTYSIKAQFFLFWIMTFFISVNNSVVSSTSSSNTMNTPASVLTAEPSRPREPWTYSKPIVQTSRRSLHGLESPNDLYGDLYGNALTGREVVSRQPLFGLTSSSSNSAATDVGEDSPAITDQQADGRAMRAYFSRAMAHLQSNALQPMAKATAREFNCWLMNVLSQPDVRISAQERRALMMNLKRISHLQKENLQLKLKKVVSTSNRAISKALPCSGGGNTSLLGVAADHDQAAFDGSVTSEVSHSRRSAADASGEFGGGTGGSEVEADGFYLRSGVGTSASGGEGDGDTGGARGYLEVGISSLDFEYHLELPQAHRGPTSQQSYVTYRPMHRTVVGSTPSLLHRPHDQPPPSGSAAFAGRLDGFSPLRSSYDAADADAAAAAAAAASAAAAAAASAGGGVEGDAASRQVDAMRRLNRQLAQQVSALVHENLRLQSVLHQAESQLLEAAVSQLKPVDVAKERAVPKLVKAAATLLLDAREGTSMRVSDPTDRGLVVASAALLRRTGLRVGDRVRLKSPLDRDRLGNEVGSEEGTLLGILVGEEGQEDATVYLHMEDNQVRQFGLAQVCLDATIPRTPPRTGLPVPPTAPPPAYPLHTLGRGGGGGGGGVGASELAGGGFQPAWSRESGSCGRHWGAG